MFAVALGILPARARKGAARMSDLLGTWRGATCVPARVLCLLVAAQALPAAGNLRSPATTEQVTVTNGLLPRANACPRTGAGSGTARCYARARGGAGALRQCAEHQGMRRALTAGPHIPRGRHYGRELAAYDVQTQRCDVYGQDAGLIERGMLVYDGLHYDALALAGVRSARRAAHLERLPRRRGVRRPECMKQVHSDSQCA